MAMPEMIELRPYRPDDPKLIERVTRLMAKDVFKSVLPAVLGPDAASFLQRYQGPTDPTRAIGEDLNAARLYGEKSGMEGAATFLVVSLDADRYSEEVGFAQLRAVSGEKRSKLGGLAVRHANLPFLHEDLPGITDMMTVMTLDMATPPVNDPSARTAPYATAAYAKLREMSEVRRGFVGVLLKQEAEDDIPTPRIAVHAAGFQFVRSGRYYGPDVAPGEVPPLADLWANVKVGAYGKPENWNAGQDGRNRLRFPPLTTKEAKN